jgi:SAM-dependent methyltransferase
MAQFKNAEESHQHSRDVLDMLYQYDTFMESIKVVADMGCGAGLDVKWFANLMTRDDPPLPYNYFVYAVDRNVGQIDSDIKNLLNVRIIPDDFEQPKIMPAAIDLMWSHDSFQYVTNPLATLKNWNEQMNTNGMLVLNVPLHTTYGYDRLNTRSFSGCYYTYNICNLMYMLAVNGFDCRDCYIYMAPNYGWIHMAVYKSMEPMNPASTTWFDLADLNLINDSVKNSLNKYGHVRQEELIFTWLDKDWRFAKN